MQKTHQSGRQRCEECLHAGDIVSEEPSKSTQQHKQVIGQHHRRLSEEKRGQDSSSEAGQKHEDIAVQPVVGLGAVLAGTDCVWWVGGKGNVRLTGALW